MSDEAIPFCRPRAGTREREYLLQVLQHTHWCGNGPFAHHCERLLRIKTGVNSLLVPSATAGLEMLILLAGIVPGDEVIMPSFTFVSTASAVALRGGVPVFVDIRPDTMNIDETRVEEAITKRTRAILAVHYAGVACAMDRLQEICRRRSLFLLEDAAQGFDASWRGQALGSIGDGGVLSFHETKNIHCGEGGALLTRRDDWAERAEILREKGTDRARFFRGEVDKYTWQDLGSSFLLSEFSAAVLRAQLEDAESIQTERRACWQRYREELRDLDEVDQPQIPEDCRHNGHIYWLKTRDGDERDRLIAFLRARNIQAVFHYIPLHSSPAGKRYGRFHGEDRYTSRESSRLLRLPLYPGMELATQERICRAVREFYRGKSGR